LLTTAYATNVNVDIIYNDFQKVFDTTPHLKLVFKLSKYGTVGKLKNWIKDYLTGRKQRVVLGEAESNWFDVKSGVRQGSVSGPLLFILYINDLPDNLTNMVKLYADDSKILAFYDDRLVKNYVIQQDIEIFANWCRIWLMNLNIK
jgi:hypothetical protein